MMERVTELLREVGREVVLPRHRQLRSGEVEEKAPGDLVTVVDREAERRITAALDGLVIGEEAVAAEPSLLHALPTADRCWLVDPLDGTHNFVEGSDDFAVMVALVERGDTVASWVHRPVDDVTWVAERGGGTWRDGNRVTLPGEETGRAEALTKYLTPQLRERVLQWGVGSGHRCAGVDYPLVAEGERDWVLFWRTLPWDHAPGALLVTEAGGVAHHLDGSPYRPGTSRKGLVVARDALTAADVASRLQADEGG